MKIFITGTDTDVGKTTVCSWLCANSGYNYFKPVQSGSIVETDSEQVNKLTSNSITVFKSSYVFKPYIAPHFAAASENIVIDINKVELPDSPNLIIEGAGGIFVPLNDGEYILDLIKKFNVPVILVVKSSMGTINHTLLSLQALRLANIPVLGVIMNGDYNENNLKSIEHYGRVKVLACLSVLPNLDYETLKATPLSDDLKRILFSPNGNNNVTE